MTMTMTMTMTMSVRSSGKCNARLSFILSIGDTGPHFFHQFCFSSVRTYGLGGCGGRLGNIAGASASIPVSHHILSRLISRELNRLVTDRLCQGCDPTTVNNFGSPSGTTAHIYLHTYLGN